MASGCNVSLKLYIHVIIYCLIPVGVHATVVVLLSRGGEAGKETKKNRLTSLTLMIANILATTEINFNSGDIKMFKQQ